VNIDTYQPLKPSFHLPRSGKNDLRISFRYERLRDYCTKCGLIGHKKLGCPHRPDLRFPLVQYSIPLQAPSGPSSRMIILATREDYDSGISSDGQAQSRTEVNSNSTHGAESAYLQLVPHFQSLDFASHVSSPHGMPSAFGLSDNWVVALFPRQMHESNLTSLNISGSASGRSVQDKGKAPLIDTYMPADFQPVSFYPSAPLYMNSTITNIQEIPDTQGPNLLGLFTDFLSTWGLSSQPITPGPSPQLFQIVKPIEASSFPPESTRLPQLGLALPSHLPISPISEPLNLPDSHSSTSPISPKPFPVHSSSLSLIHPTKRPSAGNPRCHQSLPDSIPTTLVPQIFL
jgi:hypothetical protein